MDALGLLPKILFRLIPLRIRFYMVCESGMYYIKKQCQEVQNTINDIRRRNSNSCVRNNSRGS